MISKTKLVTAGAAAALFASSAMPALAFGGDWGWGGRSNDELTLRQKNTAVVVNSVETEANSGDNEIGGGKLVFQKTGDAMAAAEVTTMANSNVAGVAGCGCFDDVTIKQRNSAFVFNKVETEANTGDNEIGGGRFVMQKTGDALAASSVATIVNENVALVGGNVE